MSTIYEGVTPENLNDRIEFDEVFEVREDGTVTKPSRDVWAPNLYEGELDSDDWDFWSLGWSRQDSYSGPIMHDSELLGRSMAGALLSEPGVYALIVSEYYDEESPDETHLEGWAVVQYKGKEEQG